ncbi:chlorhexidine efflux PACE transporter AceI [Acinetobacter sp. ANC 4641]|uniref:chlorhexidine efflux PACE transporter AceI n=1 Tax=Acinetobacter sp. ANC 4641 TaxID=2529847 RepID=UPI00103D2E3C|nr:chlorhexidine efflux PACE transporter AceI [Acinetobacter sp. ANC 4641]TCB09524.1 chlorhexidine efflux PACE transporter AceI [Acinetobacter sp. ANC 4641]
MLMSKKRWIHALSYEGILLLIMTLALSYMFEMPVELTGSLGLAIAIISVCWNMVYNNLFEKLEGHLKLQRGIWVRILHAIGFEGGLLFISVPLIAYGLNLSFLNALLLDMSITLCILVYTFIFQWCFDAIERKYSLSET